MEDKLTEAIEVSAKSSLFLISGTVVSTVVLAVSSILIGRLLGSGVYGQYTLVLSVPQIFFLFSDLGLNQGVTRFAAKLKSEGETDHLRQIVYRVLLLKTAIGVILFVLDYALADFISSSILQRPELVFQVRVASVTVLFQVIFTVATSAFVGIDKSEYNALATNVQSISKTVIQVVLVLMGFSLAGAVIGHVSGYVVAAFAAVLILFLTFRFKKSAKTEYSMKDDLKTLMGYGTPIYIGVLMIGFVAVFQNLILANFTSDAEIGNYRAASNFASLLLVLTNPIASALLPAFARFDADAKNRIGQFFRTANKYATLLVVPINSVIILFSNQIVDTVYGSNFRSASLFLVTYNLVFFLTGLGFVGLSSFYNGIGRTKITLEMNAITFFLLIALTPILTQAYAVQGLIVAFLVANAASTIFGAWLGKAKYGLGFDTRCLIKIYALSAVSCIPCLLILHATFLPNIVKILAGATIYFLLYLTAIAMANVLGEGELEKIERISKKTRMLNLIARPIIIYEKALISRRSKHGHEHMASSENVPA
jgi:O-antigen/teichoic acid export membrane protein